MNPVLAIRVIGIYAMIFGATLIGPVLVGLIYRAAATLHFLWPMAASLGVGSLLWQTGRRHPTRELGVRDGYLIVTLFWVLLSVLGAWPLMNALGLSAVDALFESTSGFTTTGATVVTGLGDLPRSVLFYRQQLQWYGGMGLVVLGVAVMPMLGIGGMQLYRAEAPGPLSKRRSSRPASPIPPGPCGSSICGSRSPAPWATGSRAWAPSMPSPTASRPCPPVASRPTTPASAITRAPGIEAVAIVFMLLAVIGMLLGRLEILTILVILSPGFWAR
jgi:trk system potassium uptake protein TrkH